ncbi:peptide deformylase [Microcella frigidaquae]|uniref:Peptide deformylase n=1 Tax=Microcella frigidaquae TaxID=424758 RepID=A0A840XIQ8_9MICO|nr:peptide deformylase [Microcella frigidaquae]MBB5616568.1 peptide deformylase [Microcella frigidaquae]NHN44822.1 peptide deformylase [Microcella frigidaquae]
MAVRPICITGESVLHRSAAEVAVIDDAVRALVADMFETMEAAPGVGLAAPQIGVDARIFVYDWTDDDAVRWRGVAINPELLVSPPPVGEADEEYDSEGCLSVPGERFPLLRSDRALLRAVDLDGEPYEIDAVGWLARIFQHENDHLDGVLYVDRLAHPHAKAAQKAVRKRSWGSPGQSWMPGVDDLEG